MAYIVTPLYGMKLADPSTIQSFETSVVNDNFLALETGINVQKLRVDEVTAADAVRPAASGVAYYRVASLAALDAIATAKVGDIARVTAAGLGVVGSIDFVAVSGAGAAVVWQADSRIAVDTRVNLDALKVVIDALSDVTIAAGQSAMTTAPVAFIYWDGTTWRKEKNFAEYEGVHTTTAIAGAGGSAPTFWGGEEVVTFPADTFTVPPIVKAVPYNTAAAVLPGMHVSDITASGFKYRMMRIGASPAAGMKVHYMAAQATSTSAEG